MSGTKASAGGSAAAPRWDLSPVYPSFGSPEQEADAARLSALSSSLLSSLESELPASGAALAAAVLDLIARLEEAGNIAENLGAYAYAVHSTDTRDERALAEINACEERELPLAKAEVIFRERLAERRDAVRALAGLDGTGGEGPLTPYAFFLDEELSLASKQMSSEMEDLANDLLRSGGDAWSRLHDALSSTTAALWDPATGERKTAIELRNLAFDPERAIRRRAFDAELEAWKAVELPMAASLNGVKGASITLDGRRGWEGALDKAAFQSRVSRATLDSLIGAMEASLPTFRRYLKLKARLLGVPSCAFYDLFAPVTAPEAPAPTKRTFPEAADFVVEKFADFDPALGRFARNAFDSSWIDAESRPGKIGGAYCTDFPLIGESRVLANFEGSFSSLTTLAHELGHAYHHEVIKDLPRSLSRYPMTLAETASIFSETIVFERALEAAPPAERLGLIEINLQDSCQVVVDILSRFYFEKAVFERRKGGELSAAEFNAMMLEAQKATYGDGLDPEALHPYMWAVKGHYYSPSLAFYNFPYAFGLLFALGLYARYRKEGPSFAAAYRETLRLTGRARAEEVARAAGYDIEGPEFWNDGLSVIASRVDEFERLAGSFGFRGSEERK